MFHGPIGEATAFFAAQGFQIPERKAVADFMQEVTSRKDQQVNHPVLWLPPPPCPVPQRVASTAILTPPLANVSRPHNGRSISFL